VGADFLEAGSVGGAAFLARTGERTRPVRRGTSGIVLAEGTRVGEVGARAF
jgi:hypothetical protein